MLFKAAKTLCQPAFSLPLRASLQSLLVYKYILFFLLISFFAAPTISTGAGTGNHYGKENLSSHQLDSITHHIISCMHLREKVNEMHGKGEVRLGLGFIFHGHGLPVKAGGSKKYGIPSQLFTDGPRGVICAKGTCFPVTIARGATWDRDLEKRVGDAMGQETRAAGCNYSGAVCMNVLRNPLWGRSQETYGEDPYLLGEMASQLVKGFQVNNVNACIKHFAANSMENNRYVVNVKMDERTLREVYLPHFKKCIDSGAMSVMSSYNRLNGCYNGQNSYLLNDILRKEWGFKGYVTSDWDNGIYNGQEGIKAGMNVEMSAGRCYSFKNIKQWLADRKISKGQIDSLIYPTIRTKILFAARRDKMKYNRGLIASAAHTALAREVAEKSAVLLKNESGLLPLKKSGLKKIAIIGSLANSKNTGDHGSSWVRAKYVVSPLEGLRNYLKNSGVEIVTANSNDLEGIKRVCKDADAVIIVTGMSYKDEGEFISMKPQIVRDTTRPEKGMAFKLGIVSRAGDKTGLCLKTPDVNVIQTAASVNDKIIVALAGGGPVCMEEWYGNVKSILQTFYNGMEGGNALARLLFGDINPSGKLPFVVPKTEADLPQFNSYAKEVNYGYYHGYTLFDKINLQPRFAFGYGLSYTTFGFSNLKVLNPEIHPDGTLMLSVDVENTGAVAGAEVAQLYIGFNHSQIDRPVKILRGFEKVSLQPHEKRTIYFNIHPTDLSYYDVSSKSWKVEDMEHEIYVGSSSSLTDLLKGQFAASGF
jgi:beta-glucosidase